MNAYDKRWRQIGRHCSACGLRGHNRQTCQAVGSWAPLLNDLIAERDALNGLIDAIRAPQGTRPTTPRHERVSLAEQEVRAMLAENPDISTLEIAKRRGCSRQAIDALRVRYNLPIRDARATGRAPKPPCRRCGQPRPHAGPCPTAAPVALTCFSCGAEFERAANVYRAHNSRRRYASSTRHFCTRDCMNRWKAANGASWFVRRRPKDWGFGGRKKAAV